ncbi:MAG TPA: GIY-YIG nuclease family protein [bacterium]|nr:GIY-YIG nuclease family protein [bacterium]
MKTYYVYILSNSSNIVLYIGVTNSLEKRLYQHKEKTQKNSFTAKYKLNKLVYYEVFEDVNNAIAREKELKLWRRKWKVDLVSLINPKWKDLTSDWE